MPMNSKTLKLKVNNLGVPTVSKESGVGRTTLYEWLKNPTADLGLKNHTAVVKAVEKLEADGGDGTNVLDTEYIAIPVFDVRASAGAGAFVNSELPIAHEKFRLSYLQELVGTGGRLDQVSFIRVTGDSMQDTLRPGDQILVDRSATRWLGEGIYIVLMDDVLQVKRLQKDEDGTLLILSDNPEYKPIKPKKGLSFQIIGQVIWFARALR